MKKILTALWTLLVLTSVCHAGSPVWKIAGRGSHLYIGGTIHMLAKSDFPLPPAFDRAYSRSDTMVFETDLAATQSPEFAKKMMGQMVYADGRTLKDRISAKTYQALGRFAGARGLALADLDRFRPGLVMVFLTMAEMERLGMAGIGVDEFYHQKAEAEGRPMQFLESPMDQIRFLADIGRGTEDEMITYILKDVGELPRLMGTVKTAWRKGDLKTIFTASLAPLKTDFPDLYHSLMVARNLNWLPLIETMLATPEVEFILVGTAHLAGEQGLISLLAKKGYTAANP